MSVFGSGFGKDSDNHFLKSAITPWNGIKGQ